VLPRRHALQHRIIVFSDSFYVKHRASLSRAGFVHTHLLRTDFEHTRLPHIGFGLYPLAARRLQAYLLAIHIGFRHIRRLPGIIDLIDRCMP
jgi:hypothetical protein